MFSFQIAVKLNKIKPTFNSDCSSVKKNTIDMLQINQSSYLRDRKCKM